MASDLIRKKTFQSASIAYVIILSLMMSIASFSWLEFQNRFPARDQDPPKKLMLKSVPETQLTKTPVPPSSSPAGITCDRSHYRYDLCMINGPAVLDPTNATIYSIGPYGPISLFEKIKPYPRKWESNVMSKVREVNVKSGPIGPLGPRCEVHHNSPALVFSAGGLTGNFFHDFNDGFIPLYVTLSNLSVANRDVILVVDHARDWWVHKYGELIRGFTKHPIINIENDTSTHCFTWAVVGLISHGFMTVDPKALPSPLTVAHFHSFFRNVYSREVRSPPHKHPMERRPKLVWLSRAGSIGRAIINQDEARAMAEEVGFDVFIYKPTMSFPMRDAYALINGSHAMIGVHGAAMTHMLMLRPGSVVVQVVPLGLEWVGEVCFGKPAREVGLKYMEYKLGHNESSLSTKYNKESLILKDPKELLNKKGWDQELMDVYLKEQDVKLDLVRFKAYMENVYEEAKQFMYLYG